MLYLLFGIHLQNGGRVSKYGCLQTGIPACRRPPRKTIVCRASHYSLQCVQL